MNNGNRYLNLHIGILLGMVLCLPVISTAQSATFDNMYDFNNWWDGSHTSIPNSQGYLSVGTTGNLLANDSTFNDHLFLLQVDHQGNKLWDKILLGIDSVNFGMGGTDYAFRLSDGHYITSGFMVDFRDSVKVTSAYLLKFDSTGTVLWLQSYSPRGIAGINYLLPQADGSFVFCGQSTSLTVGDDLDMFLAKADSTGHLLWWEEYGGTGRDKALSVVNTPDGGFLMSGFKGIGSADVAKTYLIKTYSGGNQMAEYTYNMGPWDHAGKLYPSNDGGYYIIGNTDMDADGDRYKAFLLKLDSNLDSVWASSWEKADRFYFSDMEEQANGDVVIVGGTLNKFGGDFESWLVRVAHTGTLLWERKFVSREGGSDYLRHLMSTQDHGLLMTGTARDADDNSPRQQNIWLVKTDTFGCVELGCHLTDSRGDDPELNRQMRLDVSPNPFSQQVTIHYQLPSSAKEDYTLELYHLGSGQQLAAYPLTIFDTEIVLSGQNWPQGVLIAVLKHQDQVIVRRKLVLVR